MTKWMLFLLPAAILSAANPDPKTEKEIMATMEAYKQALMKKDAAALSKILSDDLVYTHSSNLHENKTAVLESLKGNTVVEGIDFKDLKVRVYGNSAVVVGDVDFKNNAGNGATVCQTQRAACARQGTAGLAAGRTPGHALSRTRGRKEIARPHLIAVPLTTSTSTE